MWNAYSDIIERCGEPLWWDEHAVPRYVPFTPHECADIYAGRCCLLLINCQGCGAEFSVCISESNMDMVHGHAALPDMIRKEVISFGDPPNTGCCPAGPTMSSIPVQVLEYWTQHPQDGADDWTRDPNLEIKQEPAWMEVED